MVANTSTPEQKGTPVEVAQYPISVRVARPCRNMPQQPQRYRIAVTELSSSESLWSMIDELASHGFTESQIYIHKPYAASVAQSPPLSKATVIAELLKSIKPTHAGEISIAGVDWNPIGNQRAAGEQQDSAIVIMVMSETDERHDTASRILLKHGTGTMRAFECTRLQPANQ
jgi:hypothetical protein